MTIHGPILVHIITITTPNSNHNITVQNVLCTPSSSGGSGGGGGGARPSCQSNWGCSSWSLCQNAQTSLNVGLLSGEDYRLIENSCFDQGFAGESCGFQIRYCDDLNACFLPTQSPEEIVSCLYTENPTCNDGLKNCHDNSCEFLVDCGGPCQDCPTCSDGIKNQGEEGPDCSGPCPWKCIPEIPLIKRSTTLYIFLIIALVLVIIIVIRLVRVLRYKRGIALETRRNI